MVTCHTKVYVDCHNTDENKTGAVGELVGGHSVVTRVPDNDKISDAGNHSDRLSEA